MFSRLPIVNDEQHAQERRSDYDVTNTVKVSSVPHVCAAVRRLFESQFSSASFDSVWMAFHDFERLYTGKDPHYHAVDTSYHDIQHTLDVTLALARLIVGHERSVDATDRLGEDRARFAIVAALFHDAGYIRHRHRDCNAVNGAVFTTTHVTRSGAYLEKYLPKIGLGEFAPVVSRVVLHETLKAGPCRWLHLLPGQPPSPAPMDASFAPRIPSTPASPLASLRSEQQPAISCCSGQPVDRP
jgi:hypothetical protein